MNGTADAEMAGLRQEYDRLRQTANLTQATDTVWRLAREVGGFEARVEALRQGGYVFTQSLRPVYEAALTYEPETGVLEVVADHGNGRS